MPLTRLRPARTATIDRPRTASMNSSADPKARMMGRAMKMKPVSTKAPNTPPNIDEKNAVDSARAASPFLASGKPSRTVAWLDDPPGIPSRIDEKVSPVGMIARRPISMASAETSSMP